MEKEWTYTYREPIQDGFTRFRLPRRLHNQIIKNRKSRMFDTIDAYYSEDAIILEYTTSFIGKALSTLLFPVSVLMYGLSSISETFTEWKQMFNEKKYGKHIEVRIRKVNYNGEPNEKFLELERLVESQKK